MFAKTALRKLLIAQGLVFFSLPLLAQENCRGHSCNSGGNGDVAVSLVGGDSSVANQIGGHDSLGIALSSPSFRAAIGDCMGSQSDTYGFGIWGKQRMKENYWCHAVTLIKMGYVDAGAFVLCTRTILSEMPDCPGDFLSAVSPPPAASEVVLQEHAEVEQRHDEELALARMELEDLRQQVLSMEPTVVYRTDPELEQRLAAEEARVEKARQARQAAIEQTKVN